MKGHVGDGANTLGPCSVVADVAHGEKSVTMRAVGEAGGGEEGFGAAIGESAPLALDMCKLPMSDWHGTLNGNFGRPADKLQSGAGENGVVVDADANGLVSKCIYIWTQPNLL